MHDNQILNFCRVYMRLRPKMPIRPSEMAVLEVLCSVPGTYTPMSLSDILCVSRPMIAAHLNALQMAGYIVRVASPDDGRSVIVLPTKKARVLVDKTNRELVKIHLMLSEQMGVERFEKLVNLLEIANKILEEHD